MRLDPRPVALEIGLRERPQHDRRQQPACRRNADWRHDAGDGAPDNVIAGPEQRSHREQEIGIAGKPVRYAIVFGTNTFLIDAHGWQSVTKTSASRAR